MELVISVAILGIISVSLFGVVLQYFRVTGATDSRIGQANDPQVVSAFWKTDVGSIGVRTYNPSTPANPVPATQSVYVNARPPGNCGDSIAGSSPVVALAWTEFRSGSSDPDLAWNTTRQVAAYVSVLRAGNYELFRVRCSGDAQPSAVRVASFLIDIDNDASTPLVRIECDVACDGATPPSRVSLRFKTQDVSEPRSQVVDTTITADRRQQ